MIWMDIKMPVMDGYEAVRTIREVEKNNLNLPKTAIIAQTASAFEEERALVLEAGLLAEMTRAVVCVLVAMLCPTRLRVLVPTFAPFFAVMNALVCATLGRDITLRFS